MKTLTSLIVMSLFATFSSQGAHPLNNDPSEVAVRAIRALHFYDVHAFVETFHIPDAILEPAIIQYHETLTEAIGTQNKILGDLQEITVVSHRYKNQKQACTVFLELIFSKGRTAQDSIQLYQEDDQWYIDSALRNWTPD